MKKIIALLLALLLVFSVVGCAKTDDTEKPDASANAPAEESSSEASVEAGSEDAGRDTINLTLNQAIATINPYDGNALVAYQLYYQIYETLFFLNDEGELEPRLGVSYEVGEDKMTYTVKLQKGVKFHNGQEMTAEDVAWSLEYGYVTGPYTANRGKLKNVESATVIDEETIEIKSSTIDASFMGNVALYGYICCKDEYLAAVDSGKIGVEWVPYGSGPYMITSYNPDSEIVLEAFDDYWRGKARIENVNYKILSDNNTISVAFEAGDLDFIVVPTAMWSTISANDNYNTFLSPTNHTSFFHINVNNDDALSNKLVRQALSYGINREEMCIAAYDVLATPAYSMMNPETVFGAYTQEELQSAGINAYEYNPEKAKELLAEAGYPNGVDIGTITCINGSYWEKMATVFQANMSDIGVTVAIELFDSATCRSMRKEHAYQLATTGDNMAVEGLFAHYCYRLLTDEQIAAGEYTETGVYDEELEAAFTNVASTMDRDERKDAYLDLNKLLQENMYSIPTFHKMIPYAYNKNLVCDEINTNFYYIYNFHWE